MDWCPLHLSGTHYSYADATINLLVFMVPQNSSLSLSQPVSPLKYHQERDLEGAALLPVLSSQSLVKRATGWHHCSIQNITCGPAGLVWVCREQSVLFYRKLNGVTLGILMHFLMPEEHSPSVKEKSICGTLLPFNVPGPWRKDGAFAIFSK